MHPMKTLSKIIMTWSNLGPGKRDTYCINRSLMKNSYRLSENRMLSTRIRSFDGKRRGMGRDNGRSSYGAQSPPRYAVCPWFFEFFFS